MTTVSWYASLNDIKSRLGIASTTATWDTPIRACIESASRYIDAQCLRWFYPLADTREYTAISSERCYVEDLLSITTLKTDEDLDSTYETTWSSTDYRLQPSNATSYQWIGLKANGLYVFPTVAEGVQIAGKFGWSNDAVATGTTLAEDLDASETGIDVASGSAVETGWTIRIDSEDMLVTGISTNTLTVERGINGTTAATHSNGATVYYLRFPAAIVEACELKAEQLWKRSQGASAMRVGGNTQTGAGTVPGDSRIADLIAPYKRYL